MNPPPGPILVVEDIPNILELLEVTLRFKGYEVITATNGHDALEVINRERPALVITDILMPKMDGYALAQRLRTNPETRQIPLIFLSATYVTPEDRAFALSLGAKRFIEKPVDTEEFLLTVAEIITAATNSIPAPLDERAFYQGYRERLEGKVKHKNVQIARTERLLQTLPPDQKQAFEALLNDARSQKEEIQKELDELYQYMNEPGRPTLAEPYYTPAKAILDAGGLLALATDLNPGTAPCESMQFVIALACRTMRLTPAQAIAAATINAAAAIGRAERIGSLEPGKQADLLVLSVPDYRHLGYRFGTNLVERVIKKGRLVEEVGRS